MTPKHAAFLTSRILCLWFAYRAFVSLLAIPASYVLYSSLSMFQRAPGLDARVTSRLLMTSATTVISLIAEIALAVTFYSFGPRVAHFLTGEAVEDGVVAPLQA